MISRRLLEEKGIPYLPLDAIVMGFANGMPECGIHDKLFPNEIARRMWEFVKALCENLIYLGKDYVVEGEAILPENAKDLLRAHENNMKACFLGYCETTPEQKVREIKTHKLDLDDWLLKESDAYISDHVANMIEHSKFLREECKTHAIPYFDVSQDFNPAINKVFCDLLNQR